MVLRSRTLCLAAALVLASCGGDDGTTGGEAGSIVATTSIWADIASNVACGEEVAAVIPPGADPHSFEASLRDRELIEQADLVVANGGDLEEGLLDLLAVTEVDVVEPSTAIELIDGADHSHDGDDGEGGGGGDDHRHDVNPHVWHDPLRITGALDTIAAAIVASGRDADAIGRCTDAYRAELLAVDAEIADLLAPIPDDARLLVTNHDSLAYFADRYGFEVLGTVLPAETTLAETNPGDLERLADRIAARGVRAIFVDVGAARSDADALARRAGVAIVPLLTGSLSEDGSASTYIRMLRANATEIATALTP